MHITKVCDYMQAWRLLEGQTCLQEIREALELVKSEDFSTNRDQIRTVTNRFKAALFDRRWQIDVRPSHAGASAVVDAVKDRIGVEFFISINSAVPLRSIFATFPTLKYVDAIDLAIVLVPTTRLHAKGSRATYKSVVDSLKGYLPIRLPTPSVVAGYAPEPADIAVEHLTTELDVFLQQRIGLGLNEIAYKGERPSVEFKVELPTDAKKLAKEVCALANQDEGGLILVGVNDSGGIVGVSDPDEVRRRFDSIVRDNCAGGLTTECHPITFGEDAARVVLAIEISAVGRRPVMMDDRVPIRVGTTVRNARPEEVRQMIRTDLASGLT